MMLLRNCAIELRLNHGLYATAFLKECVARNKIYEENSPIVLLILILIPALPSSIYLESV